MWSHIGVAIDEYRIIFILTIFIVHKKDLIVSVFLDKMIASKYIYIPNGTNYMDNIYTWGKLWYKKLCISFLILQNIKYVENNLILYHKNTHKWNTTLCHLSFLKREKHLYSALYKFV